VQLAGWEELLLLIVGIALIAVEVLVIPGTSVAGVAGIIALVSGLAMVLVGAGATGPVVIRALGQVALSILIAMVGSLVLLRLLPQLPFGRRLILDTGMTSGLGWVSAPESDHQWLGRTGVASSPLRPAGIATIDDTRVDVVSDGAFIEAGAAVVVTRVDGNRIVVSLVRAAAAAELGDE
jgi:membrane-bound serine protease (ClpP class)